MMGARQTPAQGSHQLVEDNLEGWSLEEIGILNPRVPRSSRKRLYFTREGIIGVPSCRAAPGARTRRRIVPTSSRNPQDLSWMESDQADDEHHYHGLIEPFPAGM